MRRFLILPVVLLTAGAVLSASDRSAAVAARATLAERASVKVSSRVLQFVVPAGAASATVSVDFTAGVRTVPGKDVLLTVEAVPPGGSSIRFIGEGGGTVSGTVSARGPNVLARWVGGGQRRGRVTFTLDAVRPGAYAVPLRLLVTVL